MHFTLAHAICPSCVYITSNKNIKNVRRYRDSRTAKSEETR